MYVCKHALQAAKFRNTLVVLERWPLKDRLARREDGQDGTVAGKESAGGGAGGRVRCRAWAKGGGDRAEEN